MAKPAPKEAWVDAQRLFECGKSLSEINEATGIDRASISKRAKKEAWEKGKFQHLITDATRVRAELSTLDVETRQVVEKEIDEKAKHLEFFTRAALKNVSVAVKKIDASTTQVEHKLLAETILKGKETVIGKIPETNVVVNNSNTNAQQNVVSTKEEIDIAIRALHDAF